MAARYDVAKQRIAYMLSACPLRSVLLLVPSA
jgi:hypothetical protein